MIGESILTSEGSDRVKRIIVAGVLMIACAARGQSVVDPNLKVQRWVSGLSNPTGLALGDNAGTALVLEKVSGQVKVVAGKSVVGTALTLKVASDSERGLLGIALPHDFSKNHFVYLYHTDADANGAATANSIDRYTWNGSTLAYSKHIISLPAYPGPNHNAGRMAFGPDNKLYAIIGDLNRNERTSNHSESTDLNRIGAIIRLNPSGSSIATNPFASASNSAKSPLNDIFAYGIRNSFGMDFDPVSGDLWDTENGPESYDEINRIRPGFNSGWESIMGPTSRHGGTTGSLVSLGDRAYYSDPRFSWLSPVAPTDAMFFPSARLGGQYKNDLFVGTLHGGGILDFDLSSSRKTLSLSGPLADGVADNSDTSKFGEQSSILFGSDFGTITDLAAGPGGMYVLSYTNGTLYRITTSTATGLTAQSLEMAVPEPSAILMIGMIALNRMCRRGNRR